MAQAVKTRMTAAEFLELPETTIPTELVDGEVIVTPAPKDPHQKTLMHLIRILLPLVPGGELRVSPCDVHLDEYNVVQPDIFWVSDPESSCKLGEDGYWHGAPDLVIEILSPGTILHDRRDKFQLYEKHGAREYWIVDPDGQYVEVWILSEETFTREGIYGPDESFTSAVLGDRSVELKSVFGD